jgi:hypothetical protein
MELVRKLSTRLTDLFAKAQSLSALPAGELDRKIDMTVLRQDVEELQRTYGTAPDICPSFQRMADALAQLSDREYAINKRLIETLASVGQAEQKVTLSAPHNPWRR